MTGKSLDAGQNGRSAGASGLAVLAAGSMLAALGLSACGPDVAGAATVVRSARAATLELAGGVSRAATDGMTVPRGATVRTAPGGSVSLVAAGRTVLLGSQTAVTVLDGEREQLRAGLVMVDARRSPGLALDAGPATVQTPRGGLSRVERGALLRAASFRNTLTVRATGRKASAEVTRLHQVQVPDGGLPGRVTPLALTRDGWERRYALDLVTADTDLTALADGLDTDAASGDAVLRALPASYAASPAPGEPRSETALAFVVAKASKNKDGYATVRGLRRDGGSWGVVAALVGANIATVSAALDAILTPSPSALALGGGPPGTTTGNTSTGTGASAGPVATPSPGGSPGGRGPRGRPSPRPSPSPSDPVQDVVNTVTGLLPTPPPSPVAGATSPSPLVSVHVGGLGITVG
jgi:hypothetical protein